MIQKNSVRAMLKAELAAALRLRLFHDKLFYNKLLHDKRSSGWTELSM